ncbi:MAG: radical SAM protein [Sedimentisphaerales bacterium]|nr:radical SAM protein [Sedimentisphaerales bacterium]
MIRSQDKKWRLLRSRLGRHPLWCAWQVTYRCNFRCSFCHYWRDEMGRLPEQTVEQFEYGAGKLGRWGSMMISLAGGEPLLRDDIVDIVRVVGRWHLPFITTNGYLVTEPLARELFSAGLWGISISIDYTDEARHDRARGMEGAYTQAVKALEICSQARQYPWQRVNLMCVLLDDNLDQVEPLIQLAARYGVYFMIQPYSVMKTGSRKFRYTGGVSVSTHLLRLREKYSNFLSNPLFLQRFDLALDGGIGRCSAGKAFFNIDSTGDIAICVENRPSPVANLYRDEISIISKKLREGGTDNQCRRCWYNCRGEIESLYNVIGLWKSLPTLLFDRGVPPDQSHA